MVLTPYTATGTWCGGSTTPIAPKEWSQWSKGVSFLPRSYSLCCSTTCPTGLELGLTTTATTWLPSTSFAYWEMAKAGANGLGLTASAIGLPIERSKTWSMSLLKRRRIRLRRSRPKKSYLRSRRLRRSHKRRSHKRRSRPRRRLQRERTSRTGRLSKGSTSPVRKALTTTTNEIGNTGATVAGGLLPYCQFKTDGCLQFHLNFNQSTLFLTIILN